MHNAGRLPAYGASGECSPDPIEHIRTSAPVEPEKWSSGLLSFASRDGQSTGQSTGLVAFPLHQGREAWAVGDSAAVAN